MADFEGTLPVLCRIQPVNRAAMELGLCPVNNAVPGLKFKKHDLEKIFGFKQKHYSEILEKTKAKISINCGFFLKTTGNGGF